MSTRTYAVVRLAFAVASCPYASSSAQSRDLAQYEHTAWGVRDGCRAGSGIWRKGRTACSGSPRIAASSSSTACASSDSSPRRPDPPAASAQRPARSAGHFPVDWPLDRRRERLPSGQDPHLRHPGRPAGRRRDRDRAGLRRHDVAATSVASPGSSAGGGRRSTPPPDIREATPSRSSWTGAGRSGPWRETGSTSYGEGRRGSRSASRPGPAAAMGRWTWSRRRMALSGRLTGHTACSPWPTPRRDAAIPHARFPRSGIYSLAWSRDHPAVAIGTSGRLVRLCLPPLGGGEPGARETVSPRSLTLPFSRTAGMSGSLIVAALYDREGSLWVGTPTGIDRFRETKLTPIAPPGHLELAGVAPDTSGTAWVATRRGPPAALLRVSDRIVPRLDAPPPDADVHLPRSPRRPLDWRNRILGAER